MARMLPATLSADVKSHAERRIFTLLRDDPQTSDWTVLHSLGLPRHVRQVSGEVDFVIIVPNGGIFCMEVKGGHVACADGIWEHTNRYGDVARHERSPFRQAEEQMHSLRNAVQSHFAPGDPVRDALCGWGVAFPDIEFAVDGLEWEGQRWKVYDRKFVRPISAWVQQLIREWRQAPGMPRTIPLAPSDLRRLVQFLRPNFEFVAVPTHSLDENETRLIQLTNEQYEQLDLLHLNPRVVLDGGAGTGKTLLALEQARRLAEQTRPQRVLLLCYNRILGEHLQARLAERVVGTGDGSVTAGNLHGFLETKVIHPSSCRAEYEQLKIERKAAKEEKRFFNEDLPLFARNALLETDHPLLQGRSGSDGGGAAFDVLLVDEGQDILSPAYLDVLGDLLVGGLAGGCWAIFADLCRQALYADALGVQDANPSADVDPEDNMDADAANNALREQLLTPLRERVGTSLTLARLRMNCRNTESIGRETARLSGFAAPPFRPNSVEGPPVDYHYVAPDKELATLDRVVRELVKSGLRPEQIVLLSHRSQANTGLAGREQVGGIPLVPLTSGSAPVETGKVRFSTIHSFKGLESAAVVLLGMDRLDRPSSRRLLYVGMSRARQRLVMVIPESARAEYDAHR